MPLRVHQAPVNARRGADVGEINAFVASAKAERRVRSRMKNICNVLSELTPSMRVTGWANQGIPLHGVAVLDINDPDVSVDVDALLKGQELNQVTELQREHGFHYGKYENDKLVTYMCVTVGVVNNNVGCNRVIVSIDWIVNIGKKKNAFHMVRQVTKWVRSRRFSSFVVTQCVVGGTNGKEAKRFWSQTMFISKDSSVLVGLLHMFDERYVVYDGVVDMHFE